MNQVKVVEAEIKDEGEIEDYLHTLLASVETWEEETLQGFVATIFQLLECNPRSAPSLFDVLLYYLERSQEVAQGNIILVMAHLMVQEVMRKQPPNFTNLVTNNINLISHACGGRSNKIRSRLHECIKIWIDLEIVPKQFLLNLRREERGWTFARPPPKFPIPQEQAPSTFDLAMVGMVGRGVDTTYLNPTSMNALVQNGMKEAVQDGWLYIDENGHHKVNIEKALGI